MIKLPEVFSSINECVERQFVILNYMNKPQKKNIFPLILIIAAEEKKQKVLEENIQRHNNLTKIREKRFAPTPVTGITFE